MDGTSTFYGATPPAPSLGGITAHLLQAGDSGLALYERHHSDTDGELIAGGFYINAAPAMNAVLGRALSTLAGIVEATVQLDVSIRRSLAANQGPLETRSPPPPRRPPPALAAGLRQSLPPLPPLPVASAATASVSRLRRRQGLRCLLSEFNRM